MEKQDYEIGLFGLGVMGRNLVLNMADHGFPVAVYNRTTEKTKAFIVDEAAGREIGAGYTLEEFVGLLRKPRAILIYGQGGRPGGRRDRGTPALS